MSSRLVRFIALPIALLLPVLITLAMVWVPELLHWYVPPTLISDEVLANARSAPENSVLDEIGMMALTAAETDDGPTRTIARAQEVMNGAVTLPGFQTVSIARPLSPEDLQRGPDTFQLMMASLAPTDILLDAFRISGDDRYLIQARDDIIAFARFESSQWLNKSFMWNDHAIAARIPVLVKFWRVYRSRPEFDPAVGRLVLQLAFRSGRLLTRDSHYAYRTGHGIVSDLAAMQVSVAFAGLAGARGVGDHARARFTQHLKYYVDMEGVTLLHSAGYHSSGLKYFGIGLRLHTLADAAIPDDWWRRYELAIRYYSNLRRPDGTLPMYGDTRSVSEGLGPRQVTRDTLGNALTLRQPGDWVGNVGADSYPLSGYAIWWDRASGDPNSMPRTQTVLTFSYFQGLGHKLADELSLLTWSDGTPWITNVGYWPWGLWGRADATSWPGSNAPHRVDEPATTQRLSSLVGIASSPELEFADLLRRNLHDDFQVRRQVIRLPERETWVVLDESLGSPAPVATNWTFAPNLKVAGRSALSLRLIDAAEERAMTMAIDGPRAVQTDLVIGSRAPFGGWVVIDREPVPAPTFVVRQHSGDWVLTCFALTAARSTFTTKAHMRHWTDAEHWTLTIYTLAGDIDIQRNGWRLALGREVQRSTKISPVAFPDVDRKSVLGELADAENRYPRFAERVWFRWRVTSWVLAVWTLQLTLVFAVWRRKRCASGALVALPALGWIAAGAWLGFVYFEGMWW